MYPLAHSCITSCVVFWQNIKSPRWLRPSTAQIWHPVTYGFSQNWNHLWKGSNFRPQIRFRKIQRGSWWQLGELCEVPRCLLWRGVRCKCPVYNFSCILYLLQKSLYFPYYMAGYLLDRPHAYIYIYTHVCIYKCVYKHTYMKDMYAHNKTNNLLLSPKVQNNFIILFIVNRSL